MDERPVLSVIVPMYNEAEVLSALFSRLRDVVGGLGITYEIVCVDDGSTDQTAEIVKTEAAADSKIRLIQFSRNFGKEQALTAGMDFALGHAVVPLDADLQDPPELIGEMLDLWRAGNEVVIAVRSRRDSDTWFKRRTAHWFYSTINNLAGIKIPADAGDFRLISRPVVDEINKLREQNRFMKGIFAWVGFKHAVVTYERPARVAGTTKFNLWKLWNFALDGVTGYSTIPLRLAGYAGFFTSMLSVAYGFFLLFRTLVQGIDVPGYASLMVVVLFIGGFQLMVLGIIGEYLGRNYTESKRRPLYVVRETWGYDISQSDEAKNLIDDHSEI